MQTDSSHPGAAASWPAERAAWPNLRSPDLLIYKSIALVPVLCCRGLRREWGWGQDHWEECAEEKRLSSHSTEYTDFGDEKTDGESISNHLADLWGVWGVH